MRLGVRRWGFTSFGMWEGWIVVTGQNHYTHVDDAELLCAVSGLAT